MREVYKGITDMGSSYTIYRTDRGYTIEMDKWGATVTYNVPTFATALDWVRDHATKEAKALQ